MPAAAPTFADLAFATIDCAPACAVVATAVLAPPSSIEQLAAALAGPYVALPSTTVEPALRAKAAGPTGRPLAAQLAVTAARNVRKGRKSRNFVAPKSRVQKAKPVVAATPKKRSAKRRHVWLSAQARVIRPVATVNVVALARPTRIAARPNVQRTQPRALRLAA